jgi:hypothetical protein
LEHEAGSVFAGVAQSHNVEGMGKMRFRSCKLIASAIGLLALGSVASAAAINYGNFNGTNVMYLQVTEDSSTDPTPLFGAPTVSGDSLTFNPTSFGASATGAGGVDITDGTLASTLMTTGTKRIHKVSFAEAGDYTLAGGAGTTATAASVGASFFLRVIELDGVGVAPINFSGNMTFSPSGGTYDFVNDPHGPAQIWNGTVTFDIDALLASQNVVGQATKILLSLDNVLLAASEAGTFSTIKKKQFEGVTVTVDTDVPEPTSIAFLALGGAVLIGRRIGRGSGQA